MAYDDALAARIRTRLGGRPGVSERAMFGGLAFLLDGNMAVGVHGDELMVRVGPDAHDEAVTRPGARIMAFTSRPMRGWITVAPEGVADEAALDDWVRLGTTFASTLPPK